MECTKVCLQECPIVGLLTSVGATPDQVQKIVTTAAGELPDACGSGEPIAVRWGEGIRCDLHPEVVPRVGAVAAALQAGVVRLS